MKILTHFEQRSAAFWEAHRGLPTASAFDRIITPAKGELSAQHVKYMDELIADMVNHKMSTEPDSYVSLSMQNGIDCEPAARSWYSFENDVEVIEVGFCLSDDGRYGCSPDGLIGTEGVLEIKCPDLKTHIGYLRENKLPNDYKVQVHGELCVTGYQWCDFISYSPDPQLPNLVIRVLPDAYTDKVKIAVEEFCGKLADAMAKLNLKRPEIA